MNEFENTNPQNEGNLGPAESASDFNVHYGSEAHPVGGDPNEASASTEGRPVASQGTPSATASSAASPIGASAAPAPGVTARPQSTNSTQMHGAPVGAPVIPGMSSQSPRGTAPSQPMGYGTQAFGVAPATNRGSGASAGKTFLIAFAGALVACVLAFGAMFAYGAFFNNSGNSVTLGSSNQSTISASSEDAGLAEQVANKCLPSVVSINVLGTGSSGSGNSLYDYLYGYGNGNDQSGSLSEIGLGSGVIISDDGYIITNYHVIENGKQYQVTVGGEQKEAELVGSDSSSDIAVLKLKDGSGYTAISLGDSANIKIGEWVMSIGSPFGLEQSVATGIVSATSRSQIMDSDTDALGQSTGEVTIYPNMIQTDAAINPGNSGGALVNSNGQLIGINTLITSYSGNYSGVGFAIPSNYAISIAQSIIEGKEPTRAYLGVSMTTINSYVAQMYGFSTDSGAYISAIVPESPAADAGLQVGDIIIGFDGQTVSSASDVMLDVRTKNPGDKVSITIVRGGQEQALEVTLGQSQNSNLSNEQGGKQDSGSDGSRRNGSNSRNPFGL